MPRDALAVAGAGAAVVHAGIEAVLERSPEVVDAFAALAAKAVENIRVAREREEA